MAIPRRILVIAAGALATGALLYMRNKVRERKDQQQRAQDKSTSSSSSSSSSSTSTSTSSDGGESKASADGPAGSKRELSLFLAGESWYDEVGWQGIWEREAIESPEAWLK